MSGLRGLLHKVDASAVAIRAAAGAMMKHYETSANVAVTEWRNALHSADRKQFMPLLYVANEVVQSSRNNRGNKFVEAFAPVLAASLKSICSRDPSVTEKVRRTAKIWGDRHVYSVRFVTELLATVEKYRPGMASHHHPEFSPNTEADSLPAPPPSDDDDSSSKDDTNDILDADDSTNRDDDDIFGNSGSQQLDIEITSALEATEQQQQQDEDDGSPNRAKRRRSSGSTSRRGSASFMSTSNLSEMWTQLDGLRQQYEKAEVLIKRIDEYHVKNPKDQMGNLVGDQLEQAFRKNETFATQMETERRGLHAVAQERHRLERQATLYLPWLERALKQDQQDLTFCDTLEAKIHSFRDIHKAAQEARTERLADESRREKEEADRLRKKKEQEELDNFRAAALARQTEAQPGMVWNRMTGEYQARNTEDSWRD